MARQLRSFGNMSLIELILKARQLQKEAGDSRPSAYHTRFIPVLFQRAFAHPERNRTLRGGLQGANLRGPGGGLGRDPLVRLGRLSMQGCLYRSAGTVAAVAQPRLVPVFEPRGSKFSARRKLRICTICLEAAVLLEICRKCLSKGFFQVEGQA